MESKIDWTALLRYRTMHEVAATLAALPLELQAQLAPAFSAQQPEPPWDMSCASTTSLLHELDLHALYGETFDEYEFTSVRQLRALDDAEAELRSLGVTRDHRDRICSLAASPRPRGTCGTCFDATFLHATSDAWAAHMGCENMGTLLYALCRFTKPRAVLEVGAGFTSIWLLQALRDNHEELRRCHAACEADGYRVGAPPPGAEWMVADELRARARHVPVLHCVDNMAHSHTTAHKVREAAAALGLSAHLRLHEADAYALADEWPDVAVAAAAEGAGGDDDAGGEDDAGALDLIWLDFGIGVGGRLDAFLSAWWPRLRPGGWLVVHSTLTNAMTRHWLEKMRARVGSAATGGEADAALSGDFRELSFLEPHKRYQNSCSWFQKREGYAEPVLTQYP